MRIRTPLCLLFFALSVMLLGTGCASSSKKGTASVEVDEKERVSTLPWNTPQKWESGTGLGTGVNY